mmetsp:Transcript_14745/g.28377  ORF Transcript_14745/g.28377 Transcript_14745/m.28377 type:complete len:289 (+) Transcript_14745:507-1373(+)
MPPSSAMVDSTFCNACARLCCTLGCTIAICWLPPRAPDAPEGECASFPALAPNRGLWPEPPDPGRGSLENRPLRLSWALRFSVRIVSTSLNSLVAFISLDLRLFTTVDECSTFCLLLLYPLPAWCEKFCSSVIAPFSVLMSCLMIVVSSAISCAGSSKIEVRLASCASLDNLAAVPCIPCPTRAARRANSDLPSLEGPGIPWSPLIPPSSPTPNPAGFPCCLRKRSAIAKNSEVRSRQQLLPEPKRSIAMVCEDLLHYGVLRASRRPRWGRGVGIHPGLPANKKLIRK